MDDGQEARKQIDLNVAFTPAPPRPRKVHRVRDICWIVLAAALIGTALHSSLAFAVVAFASILLYIVGGPVVKSHRQ